MAYKPKAGSLSKEDLAYVKAKADKLTPEQIALKLGRSVGLIQKKVDRILGIREGGRVSLLVELEQRPEYKKLRQQLSKDELDEFKHHYVQIMSQMQDNIQPTEELQVFQVITLKILMDRTLMEQKHALDDMQASHAALQDLRASTKPDRQKVAEWDAVYEGAKQTNKSCADRYKIYSDRQDKLLGSLKATRDQRVKTWEAGNNSFLGILRKLTEEEVRERIGNEMEMMRIAQVKERERLSQPHKYKDGTYDIPLLTPETSELFESEVQGVEGDDTPS